MCKLLWLQHTDEMILMQNNIFNIDGKKVTVEFQPSADQKWQIFAAGETTVNATYPSNYAFVHKNNLSDIDGSI